jgi:hypothetical protein
MLLYLIVAFFIFIKFTLKKIESKPPSKTNYICTKINGFKNKNYIVPKLHQYTNMKTKNHTTSTKCQYHAEPSKAILCVQNLKLYEFLARTALSKYKCNFLLQVL